MYYVIYLRIPNHRLETAGLVQIMCISFSADCLRAAQEEVNTSLEESVCDEVLI